MQIHIMSSIPGVESSSSSNQAQDLSTNLNLDCNQARMEVSAGEGSKIHSSKSSGNENPDLLITNPSTSSSHGGPSPRHGQDNVLYSLKWNEFDKQLSSGFSNLFYTQDFADVTLCCEGKSAQAHKVVLAMCSPYFRQIFKENPCKHPVVIIKGINFHDLQHVLKFIYFGQVSVVEKEIQNFIDAAELLKLDGISSGDLSDTHPYSRSNFELRAKPDHSRHFTCQGLPGPNQMSRGGPDFMEDSRKSDGSSSESQYEPRISPNNFLETQLCQGPGMSPTGSVISHGKRKQNGMWRSPSTNSVIPHDRSSPPEMDHNSSSNCSSVRNSKMSPVIVENMIAGGNLGRSFLSDKTSGPATISRSSSGSGGDPGGLEPPLPVVVSLEEHPEGISRLEGGGSGEYELSIRNVDTTLGPMKSFTTPSGMVVTSTLRNHPGSCSTNNPPSPWNIGQQMKPPIPSSSLSPASHLNHHHHHHHQHLHSSNSVIKGVPPHLRSGVSQAQALSFANGPLFNKIVNVQNPDGAHSHSPSSVPAKKRFSHFSHRFPMFPGVEICPERNFMDLDQRSMMKVGGGMPASSGSSGSPTSMPGMSGGASLSLVPRLKNQRHSQVPQSARYTTAEVDAMVDSVTNHSGPFVPCKICDKLVKRERLRAHIHECHLVHGEKIICPHCGVGLKSKGSYRVHVWRHRRGVLTKGLKSKRVIVQRTRPSSPK